MNTGKTGSERILQLYSILKEESDEAHPISMTRLIGELETDGCQADRRTIYHDMELLNQYGFCVHYARHGQKIQGYWLEHAFTPAETVLLAGAVEESLSLTEQAGSAVIAKLLNSLSGSDRSALKLNVPATGKTDNPNVLNYVDLILQAIRTARPIEFRYYDMTISREKKYRRSAHLYHEVPYAVVTDNGRIYCILYASKYGSFGAFRVDKMDAVSIVNEPAELKPFDLNRFMQASFHMYTGTPETITCEFDLSLLNPVFDQFGRSIIISSVKEHSFTASIQASVTPTLISWLLQFYDRITVLKPASLIQKLSDMGDVLQNRYGS